ncbi:MAG: DUF106 domain-containing protein [Methanomicrobiales archaeon]|nr:DUF106 domain-containing protein [Methanomicrobiales archaeon]
MAKGLGQFSFFFVMILAMVVYSIESIRVGIGSAMDMIFAPIVQSPDGGYVTSWLVIILALAAITGVYSSLLQKYTIDYEKMQVVQKKMRDFQKDFREAQLSGDEKKVKKMMDKRDKLMQEQLEMSQEQFKPMSYIMVITVPIFLWLLYKVPDMGSIVFPFWGELNLADGTPFFLPAWILWYMICSLTLSQVIRKSLNIGGL